MIDIIEQYRDNFFYFHFYIMIALNLYIHGFERMNDRFKIQKRFEFTSSEKFCLGFISLVAIINLLVLILFLLEDILLCLNSKRQKRIAKFIINRKTSSFWHIVYPFLTGYDAPEDYFD